MTQTQAEVGVGPQATRIMEADSSHFISYIEDTFEALPCQDRAETLAKLGDMINQDPQSLKVLMAFDADDRVLAYSITYAPRLVGYVVVVWSWGDRELRERLLFHSAIWAQSLGRGEMHLESTKANGKFYKDRGFGLLSSRRMKPLPEGIGLRDFTEEGG